MTFVQKPHHSTPLPHSFTQAIVNGPTIGVPRQAFPYRHLTLTSLTVPNLPQLWYREEILGEGQHFLVHKKARRDKVRKVLKCTYTNEIFLTCSVCPAILIVGNFNPTGKLHSQLGVEHRTLMIVPTRHRLSTYFAST
ncbi:hypothetical protein EDB86DRAFT_2877709 [Lactarius hatsudake]|nr:hypothetical protein EDB86DRAFT_2877709 [Lactarius hatsudake]